MLISLGNTVKEITQLQLPISPESEIINFEVLIREKHINFMNKKSRSCKTYQSGKSDFYACTQQIFAAYFKEKVNCTLAGINIF